MIRPVVSTTTHGCSRTPRRSRRGGGQPTPRPAGRSALRSPSPGLALRSGRCTRPRRVQLVTSAGCNGKNVNSDLFHTTHKSEPDPGPARALGLAAWKPDPTAEQTARSLGPSPGGASHGGIRRPPEPGGRHWAAGAALTSLLPPPRLQTSPAKPTWTISLNKKERQKRRGPCASAVPHTASAPPTEQNLLRAAVGTHSAQLSGSVAPGLPARPPRAQAPLCGPSSSAPAQGKQRGHPSGSGSV